MAVLAFETACRNACRSPPSQIGRSAMWSDIACSALAAGKRLELRYDGWTRVVEVHTVGVSTAGNAVMSVWQVRGGSNSNERVGWKLMRLDEAIHAIIIDEKSEAPRPGYQRNARNFDQIRCQL